MVNPQKENGYTMIANELVEAFCKYFPGYSCGQLMFAILRKTYGWHKKEDKISISQLQQITGLSRRTVIYSLQELEAKKFILITRKDYQINWIKFNKHYDTWEVQNSAPQVINNRNRAKIRSAKLRHMEKIDNSSAKLHKEVVQNSVKDSNSFAPTKETIQKKDTKEILRSGEAANLNALIYLFKNVNPSYEQLFKNKTQRACLERLVKLHTYEKIEAMIKALPQIINRKYAPRATTPYQLETKLGELVAFIQQEQDKAPKVAPAFKK